MALLALLLLVPGVLLVAAAEGLLPAPWPTRWQGPRLQAWGGTLTLLGLASVGAGLPHFH